MEHKKCTLLSNLLVIVLFREELYNRVATFPRITSRTQLYRPKPKSSNLADVFLNFDTDSFLRTNKKRKANDNLTAFNSGVQLELQKTTNIDNLTKTTHYTTINSVYLDMLTTLDSDKTTNNQEFSDKEVQQTTTHSTIDIDNLTTDHYTTINSGILLDMLTTMDNDKTTNESEFLQKPTTTYLTTDIDNLLNKMTTVDPTMSDTTNLGTYKSSATMIHIVILILFYVM